MSYANFKILGGRRITLRASTSGTSTFGWAVSKLMRRIHDPGVDTGQFWTPYMAIPQSVALRYMLLRADDE